MEEKVYAEGSEGPNVQKLHMLQAQALERAKEKARPPVSMTDVEALLRRHVADRIAQALEVKLSETRLSKDAGSMLVFSGGWSAARQFDAEVLQEILDRARAAGFQGTAIVLPDSCEIANYNDEAMLAHGWTKAAAPVCIEKEPHLVWREKDGSWWRIFADRLVASSPPRSLLEASHMVEEIRNRLIVSNDGEAHVNPRDVLRGIADLVEEGMPEGLVSLWGSRRSEREAKREETSGG